MASKRIEGITIEIGGDLSGLNKAIKGANKELNSLQKELRGVDSLLKLDPGNVDLLTQKEKLLADAIEGTEKKLKDLQAAKEEADKLMAEGGEVNEEAYRNLQREIVATEQKLKSLEEEQKAFGSVTKQQLEAAAQKFDELGSKVEGVGKKLTPLSGAAAGALAGMGGLAVKAGKAADEINTLSKVTGISTEELQKFKYGAELVDVSTEDIARSVQKLKKSMSSASSGTGDAAKAFARLGISTTGADGSLRDSTEVFYEAIDALGKMENETERDALAMQIFGKSAANLNPLIEEGSQAFADAAANATIMSQAQLDAANEFNDVIDQTKATVGSALMALGATIGQTLMPILQKLAGWITQLSDYLANMNPTVLKVIMVISGVVAALAPVLILVGKLISSVGTILRLIPMVTTGIKAVSSALLANPIAIVIAAIAGLIAYLVHLYNTNEDFRIKVQAIFEKIKGAFNTVVAVVKSGIDKVKGFIADVKEKIASIWATVLAVKAKIEEVVDGFVNIGRRIVEGIWNGIKRAKDWLLGKIKDWCGSVVNGIKSFFGIHSPSKVMAEEVGEPIAAGVAEGILDNADLVSDAMAELYDDAFGIDFSDAVFDMSDAANLAVDASYQQSDELLDKIATATAQYIGQALLDGLVGIQNTILAAMPASLALNVDGRKLAETTFSDYDDVASGKSRIFAPSRQTIANIAASVVNTYVSA